LTHAQSGPVPAPQTGIRKARAKQHILLEATDLIGLFGLCAKLLRSLLIA